MGNIEQKTLNSVFTVRNDVLDSECDNDVLSLKYDLNDYTKENWDELVNLELKLSHKYIDEYYNHLMYE